ncbi:MAG TPA: pyridoxal-dependent decarboxylase, partial [Kofleriaceae bacterium]|nr:pyridoxal-dependent decarboxylase [Kofleriaceae bacterium]
MLADPQMSLDPPDWDAFRRQAHTMLDDAIDHVRGIAAGPVWRPMPPEIRESFAEPLPVEPTPLADVHRDFTARILPYHGGNAHPRFVGWVQGGGNVAGMMAELLAAAIDANAGGRDHAALEVERQIARWMRDLFGFPATAQGLLVTGSSLANWMAIVIAKTQALGVATRRTGIAGAKLRAYASAAAHQCVLRAMEMSGLGSDALVVLPVGRDHRVDPEAIRAAIAADR